MNQEQVAELLKLLAKVDWHLGEIVGLLTQLVEKKPTDTPVVAQGAVEMHLIGQPLTGHFPEAIR